MNYPASTVVGSPVAILSLHTKPTIFISLQTKIIKTYRNTTENVTYDKKTKTKPFRASPGEFKKWFSISLESPIQYSGSNTHLLSSIFSKSGSLYSNFLSRRQTTNCKGIYWNCTVISIDKQNKRKRHSQTNRRQSIEMRPESVNRDSLHCRWDRHCSI